MNITEIIGLCYKFEIINIRGFECLSCTAPIWYRKNKNSLHADSSRELCEFKGNSGDVVDDEDNFGNYEKVNPAFRCTSSGNSTTQIWMGGQ